MIKGGPKVVTDGLVLCLDAHDAKSYAGEPVTNLASDSAYTWVNSGAWTQNTYTSHESSPVGFPPGLKGVSGVQVLEGICTTAGSIHFGTGHVNPASASTQYTYSVWFYQKGKAGIGGPYARANVSNSNLGTMKYNGTTGSSNWPVNKWIKLEITFTTQGSDTQTYISNYFGSQVGDTMYFCAAQSEQKSYYSPSADSSRSATDGWKDRTVNSYDGTLVSMVGTGASHYRDGQVIMPVSNSYLEFDGTNDYIDLGTTAGNFGTDPFTVSVWLNFDALGSFYNKYAADQDQILFSHSGGKPYFIYNAPNGTDYGYTVSNTTISTGTWYNLVATVDRSSNFPVIYVNGVNDGSSSQSSAGSPTTANMDNTGNLRIGRGLYAGNYSYFNGKMAQLLVYKGKALTAAEVLSNYNATKQRFS